MLHGIDIASWQEGIDVANVEGDFVIIKATGGTSYTNPFWRQWVEQALAAGKLVGIYHYAMEYGAYNAAAAEAQYFLDATRDFKGQFIPVLDFEADAQGLPVSWPHEWLDIVARETGATPMFYAYASYLNSRDHGEIAHYPLWMASYLDRYSGGGYVDDPDNIWDTSNWDHMTAYQYTSTGFIGGYDGPLDLNVFYGSREDWLRMCGKDDKMAEMREKMVQHAIDIANDDSHGYSWADRWNIDRDCASLMYDSGDAGGYPVGRGPDKTRYTGTMIDDFTAAGFTCLNAGEITPFRGCIALRDPWGENGHTEMYIDQWTTVGADIAETGGVYGEPGDQTGYEISITPDPGGWDYILVPPAEEKPKGWEVIMWQSHGGSNQRWIIESDGGEFVTIKNLADGRYLDVAEVKDENGAEVILWSDFNGGKNQLWKLVLSEDDDGCHFIQSAMDGNRVLDVVGGDSRNGAKLCIWPKKEANSANQKWMLLTNYDGTYTILNNGFSAKLVLDSKGGGK